MRIVNAMFGRGQGGIEQAMVDYCEALRGCGHEPVALVHPRAAVVAALIKHAIPVHAVANWGEWDPLARAKLRRLIRRIAPDACIAHGNRAVGLLSAAKAPHLVGALHNYSIKTHALRFVFYPTQDLMRHAQAQRVAGQHLYLVPNLVRVPAEPPARAAHVPPVIGSMGRFVAKKGFALFIEALALLNARGIDFHAVLGGEGEDAQALKTLVQAKGLHDRVRFTGWVEEKQAFFDSLDIFCLPSHHEPFGIVLLEAMAHALPVVATDSEGPREILHGGGAGVLVPKDDAAALADALAALISDPRQAALLARNAYDGVKRRYDLPVVAHKLDLALRTLCRL